MKKEMANGKKAYTKPVVLAATKKSSNFSAGCTPRTGQMCSTCRCK